MNKLGFMVLFLGIFLFAMLIGGLTGISSSPVLTTVIPLIFSIFTAGGAIYSIKLNLDKTLAASTITFVGSQLIIFSVGFSLGVWGGVSLKLAPEDFWNVSASRSPAYADLNFTDFRLLSAALELDKRMVKSGLNEIDRKKIFDEIENARISRKEKATKIGLTTNDLLATWEMPQIKETHDAAKHLQQLIRQISYTPNLSDKQKSELETINAEVSKIVPRKNVNFGEKIANLLEKYANELESYQSDSLLRNDEVEAIMLVLGKVDTEKPDTSWPWQQGKLIADVNRDPFSDGRI